MYLSSLISEGDRKYYILIILVMFKFWSWLCHLYYVLQVWYSRINDIHIVESFFMIVRNYAYGSIPMGLVYFCMVPVCEACRRSMKADLVIISLIKEIFVTCWPEQLHHWINQICARSTYHLGDCAYWYIYAYIQIYNIYVCGCEVHAHMKK